MKGKRVDPLRLQLLLVCRDLATISSGRREAGKRCWSDSQPVCVPMAALGCMLARCLSGAWYTSSSSKFVACQTTTHPVPPLPSLTLPAPPGRLDNRMLCVLEGHTHLLPPDIICFQVAIARNGMVVHPSLHVLFRPFFPVKQECMCIVLVKINVCTCVYVSVGGAALFRHRLP